MAKIQKTILQRYRKKQKTCNPFLAIDFLSPEFTNSIESGSSCFGAAISFFLLISLFVLSLLVLRADLYSNITYPVKNRKIEQGLNVTIEIKDLE